MKIKTDDGVLFTLNIVPRRYAFSFLNVSIKDYYSNEVLSFESEADIYQNLLSIDLKEFIPIYDTKYEFTIKDETGEVIWFGSEMYTTKDVQNYQLNNSDENKLRF